MEVTPPRLRCRVGIKFVEEIDERLRTERVGDGCNLDGRGGRVNGEIQEDQIYIYIYRGRGRRGKRD